MTFEEILPFIKDGVRVSRKNWGEYSIKSNGNVFELDECSFKNLTHNDIFSNDWYVVED